MKRRGAADPVTPELRAYVARRDGSCVVARLVDRGEVARASILGECEGRDTFAHVRDSRGGRLGKRPPSTPRRVALVCERHALPPDNVVDRADVRPAVDRYLESKEGPDVDGSRPWETVRRIRATGEPASVAAEPGRLARVDPGTIPVSGRRSEEGRRGRG